MKVLYFAEIKEVLDKSSEDIDLSYDITVDEFVSDLFERYPSCLLYTSPSPRD